jgi:hypothetical protein
MKYPDAYSEALRIAEQAPGTVCVNLRHYAERRHPVPYRMGTVHRFRRPGEHWHADEQTARRCPDDWMKAKATTEAA